MTGVEKVKAMNIDEMASWIMEIKLGAIQHAMNAAGIAYRITDSEKERVIGNIREALEEEWSDLNG